VTADLAVDSQPILIYKSIYLSIYIYPDLIFPHLSSSPNPPSYPIPTAKLAQSRPPPVRIISGAVTTPPLSPGEKASKHRSSSSKRSSAIITSDKKSRPLNLGRRSTPQHISRTSSGGRGSSKEKESDDDRGLVGESFPQFWYVASCTHCTSCTFFPNHALSPSYPAICDGCDSCALAA
jgi:hypothetical protein